MASFQYPDVVTAFQKCVTDAGLDYTPIGACYGGGAGAEGTALVLANAARTAALKPAHQVRVRAFVMRMRPESRGHAAVARLATRACCTGSRW